MLRERTQVSESANCMRYIHGQNVTADKIKHALGKPFILKGLAHVMMWDTFLEAQYIAYTACGTASRTIVV